MTIGLCHSEIVDFWHARIARAIRNAADACLILSLAIHAGIIALQSQTTLQCTFIERRKAYRIYRRQSCESASRLNFGSLKEALAQHRSLPATGPESPIDGDTMQHISSGPCSPRGQEESPRHFKSKPLSTPKHLRQNITSGHKTQSSNAGGVVGYDSSDEDNIKVYVRVRPPDKPSDSEIDQSICVNVTGPSSLTLQARPDPKVFTYDHVADPNTTQEEVFSTVGKKIIESCVAGYNGTIFAYGQTGSGKTFTMLGPPDEGDNFTHDLRGVIPRGFEYLFSLLNREHEKHGDRMEFLCRCSFLEIYNEQLSDLLDPASISLHLREDMKKGVFVSGLKEKDISSSKDAIKVLQSGWLNRRVASTSMNRESSRSHAVFTVSLESREKKGSMANIKESKLHLVDLAGSERQRDTHTEGVRLKEAGSINRSLSALGNVIMALVDIAHGKTRHIHYRDSKLTFILRDSLGGNAKTCIIANIHPSARCFGETLSTLNFARRAKMIKNKAIVNEDVTGNVAELQAEIRKLKELLQSKGSPEWKGLREQYGNAPEQAPTASAQQDSESTLRWKEMMLAAISEREKAEEDKEVLQKKIVKLEDLCSRKEKFLQSTKMILKFRENYIAKLEKGKTGKGASNEEGRDKELQLLKDEIKLLHEKIEHHPDVTRFAMENLELRAEVKRLKSLPSNGSESPSVLSKASRYTLNLERQLKEIMLSTSGQDKVLSSSMQSLEVSNAEIEQLKRDVNQLQGRLDSCQQELAQSRQEHQQLKEELVEQAEGFRKRELDLQSTVRASTTACSELESALESHRLKTALDRTTLNTIHMQTIKTLTSPLRFSSPLRSTPQRKKLSDQSSNVSGRVNKSLDNSSESFLANEKPPQETSLVKRMDSYDDSDSDGDDFFNGVSGSLQSTSLCDDALVEEVKKYQDICNKQEDDIQSVEKNRIMDKQLSTRLQHQVKELEETLTVRTTEWSSKETSLSLEILSLTDSLKTSQSEATVLKSEVEDLRVMLQSAYKQVDAVKCERGQEGIESGRKYAAVESKFLKLESDFLSLQNEMEAMTETAQLSQSEVETCRAELAFLQHKSEQLKEIVNTERDKAKRLEQENEEMWKKLDMEIDINMKLSQQDSQQELVEENKSLRSTVDQLNAQRDKELTEESRLREDLQNITAELSSTKKRHEAEKTALIEAVQEAKSVVGTKEAEVLDLCAALEEAKSRNEELVQVCDDQNRQAKKASDAVTRDTVRLTRGLTERENEIADLRNELDTVNEQFHQLTQTLQCEGRQTMKSDVSPSGNSPRSDDLQPVLPGGDSPSGRSLRNAVVCADTADDDKKRRIDDLSDEIRQLKEDLAQHIRRQQEHEQFNTEVAKERLEWETRLKKLEGDYQMASEDNEYMIDELQRTRDLEKKLFDEKETLRSSVVVMTEEKRRLQMDNEQLVEKVGKLKSENTKLAGHQNLNQRIQYLVTLKNENQSLKEQLNKAQNALATLKEDT